MTDEKEESSHTYNIYREATCHRKYAKYIWAVKAYVSFFYLFIVHIFQQFYWRAIIAYINSNAGWAAFLWLYDVLYYAFALFATQDHFWEGCMMLIGSEINHR